MNSTVFHWPEHIVNVLDLAQARIFSRREGSEDELKKSIAIFEEKLELYTKEIEAFRKKEVRHPVVALLEPRATPCEKKVSFILI